jgi:enoyl-CoA hydratase/carnithine racemase
MTQSHDVVTYEVRGKTAIITLNRPEKRNAFSQRVFDGFGAAFARITDEVRAVVIAGNGQHFCAGLDLSEHQHVPPFQSMLNSRAWHRLFDDIQNCGRPVISALHGAVIGGGLELASATHIRVADRTAFYQLPEGRRGIFLGGGGSVRIAKIIGVSRLTEMMLTGRRLDADDGERIGLSHYLVEPGESLKTALEIAENVAGNAEISNYLMLIALAKISEMPDGPGLFTEAVSQALTLTTDDAKAGIQAFLQKRDIRF